MILVSWISTNADQRERDESMSQDTDGPSPTSTVCQADLARLMPSLPWHGARL
jgi:hypothetical protein